MYGVVTIQQSYERSIIPATERTVATHSFILAARSHVRLTSARLYKSLRWHVAQLCEDGLECDTLSCSSIQLYISKGKRLNIGSGGFVDREILCCAGKLDRTAPPDDEDRCGIE